MDYLDTACERLNSRADDYQRLATQPCGVDAQTGESLYPDASLRVAWRAQAVAMREAAAIVFGLMAMRSLAGDR